MNFQSFLIGFLTAVLIGQLSYIQPSLTLERLSYGVTRGKDVFISHTPQKKPESARFVFAKQRPDTVIFVGDVMLARNVEFLMQQKGRGYPFAGFDLHDLSKNAYIVGNFEAPIPKVHRPTSAGEMKFSVDPLYVSGLELAGFNHFSLANNHTYDHGENGLQNTISELTNAGFTTFGDPKGFSDDSVSYLESSGGVVALIAIHALEKLPTTQELTTVFAKAAKKSDLQVAYVHWGTEYKTANDDVQRRFAESLVKAGADVIVGHHPHVVENIDVIDGVPVFYSLGNYIFDQYLSSETEQGLVLTLELSNDPVINLMPISSESSPSQPRMLPTREHAAFLAELAKKSDPTLRILIERGVIPLNSLVASSPKIAMMD